MKKKNLARKTCAYCDSTYNSTKEHIWPRCMIKRLDGDYISVSLKAMKAFRSEMTISDVCAKCNNGYLGELDRYICQQYDLFFGKFPTKSEEVVYSYNYVMLARWLLKISYNSARAASNKNDIEILEKLVPFIRGEVSNHPDWFSIRLETIAPSRVTIKTELYLDVEIKPKALRCTSMRYVHQDSLSVYD